MRESFGPLIQNSLIFRSVVDLLLVDILFLPSLIVLWPRSHPVYVILFTYCIRIHLIGIQTQNVIRLFVKTFQWPHDFYLQYIGWPKERECLNYVVSRGTRELYNLRLYGIWTCCMLRCCNPLLHLHWTMFCNFTKPDFNRMVQHCTLQGNKWQPWEAYSVTVSSQDSMKFPGPKDHRIYPFVIIFVGLPQESGLHDTA